MRNLAIRNAGRMILMDLEHELRAVDQARFITDGIHFDKLEGQSWKNCVFEERLNEMEVKTSFMPAISTFMPPNLERRLESFPAVPQLMQSSVVQATRSDLLDRLGKAPARGTIYPRRRLRPVNQTVDSTSGTPRSETKTTTTSREERHPDVSLLMWSRPIPFPWHIHKQYLMKLNLQT